MADIRPIGNATTIAIAETSIVPTTSGRTPKCWFAKSGVHSVPVRNSRIGTSRRNSIVSTASTMMMPAVVNTDSAAATSSPNSITRSNRRGCMDGLAAPFLREQPLDLHGHRALRTGEERAWGPGGETFGNELVSIGAESHVVDLTDERIGLVQVELDELLNLGPAGSLVGHIDEDRSRQRLVGAGPNRLCA